MRFIPEGSGPLLSLAAIAVVAASCTPAVDEPVVLDSTPVQSQSKLIWTSPEGCKVYRLLEQYNEYSSQYIHVVVCSNTANASAGNVLAN